MESRQAWLDDAAKFVVQFAAARGNAPFLMEDVVALAAPDLRYSRDQRAWGGAAHRAKSWGSIKRVGYAQANTSNRSPKVLWQYTGRMPAVGG